MALSDGTSSDGAKLMFLNHLYTHARAAAAACVTSKTAEVYARILQPFGSPRGSLPAYLLLTLAALILLQTLDAAFVWAWSTRHAKETQR